tara:strand:+ start:23040 stop:25175 length:2136 start_codon:yes stop_codon:yes gene_type:complete
MGAARLGSIVAVLILIISGLVGANSEGESEAFLQGNSNVDGPFWIEFSCELDACQDMELVVWTDDSQYRIMDTHLVEWSGLVNGSVSWELLANPSLNIENFAMSSIIGKQSDIIENSDLPDLVPSPGQQGEWASISASSNCQLNRCSQTEILSEGTSFVGVLDTSADDDAILVEGDTGDVVKISNIESPDSISIEYWSRSDSKILIGSISSIESNPVYLDYPEDAELWIRIVHSDESDFSPYRFDLVRFDDESEGPAGEELGNPWTYEYQLSSNSTSYDIYRGHISSNDPLGDSILISTGAKINLPIICRFTGEVALEILLHKLDGGEEIILEDSNQCPQNIETSPSSTGIEFRIKSEQVIEWEIEVTSTISGDGVFLGDAPDLLWLEAGPSEFWGMLSPSNTPYSGSLGIGDMVDIYPFEITDSNGSRVMIRSDIESPVTYQIQTLSQDSWKILNYTNGTVISVPPGIHAVRIEGLSPIVGDVEYEFYIVYLGEDIPDEGEYRDLSHLFTNFYVLIGGLMLLPLAVVFWWNRSMFLDKKNTRTDFEIHGIKKLELLRERLSVEGENIEGDTEGIVKALSMLGDSSWDEALYDLGKPSLRHMTDQIEICSWIIPESSFLILGIRTFQDKWELTALSVSSPEGSTVSIAKVSPEHMFEDREIFLDTLNPGTKRFLSLEISGNPSLIELEVSGLIDGEPLAAVPREAISFVGE